MTQLQFVFLALGQLTGELYLAGRAARWVGTKGAVPAVRVRVWEYLWSALYARPVCSDQLSSPFRCLVSIPRTLTLPCAPFFAPCYTPPLISSLVAQAPCPLRTRQ